MARFDSAQRARILEAAIRVFAEQGLEGAAIRMVGKAAGVNSALLYYYFENKHTLFVEAVRVVIRGLLDSLATRRREFSDGRERLTFLVDGLFDYYGAHPARLRLMSVAITLHGDLLGRVVEDVAREGSLVPLEVLAEGITRNQLRAAHPIQVWWSILGVCLFSMHMGEVRKHIDHTKLPMPLPDFGQVRKEVINLLCDGLSLPRGRSKSTAKGARL